MQRSDGKERIGKDAAVRHTFGDDLCKKCVFFLGVCVGVCVTIERNFDPDPHSSEYRHVIRKCNGFREEMLTTKEINRR